MDQMSNRTMIAVLAVSAFIGMTAIVSFDLLMPGIAEDLGTSVAAIAQISFVMYVMGASLGLLLGPVADHYGLRRTMMFGGLVLALSCVATALSTSYWMLLVSRLPVGIGIMGAVSVAIAASRLPEDDRRKGIGWISTVVLMAAILGSPTLGMIAHYSSWRISYVVLAGVFLTITTLLWRFVPADPPWPQSRFNTSAVVRAYQPILRHSTSVFLYISDMFRGTSIWLLFIFFSAFLIQRHGLSLQQVSLVYTSIGIAYVVGTRFGNGDFRWLSLHSLYAGSTLAMLPLIFLVLSGTFSLTVSIVVLLPAMFFAGIGYPAITIMISEESRGGQGTTMMLRRAAFAASQAVAASAGGALLSLGGFSLLAYGVVAFGLCAVAVVIVAGRLAVVARVAPAPAGE
jgi:predicted MFS family arabinose efflux permease